MRQLDVTTKDRRYCVHAGTMALLRYRCLARVESRSVSIRVVDKTQLRTFRADCALLNFRHSFIEPSTARSTCCSRHTCAGGRIRGRHNLLVLAYCDRSSNPFCDLVCSALVVIEAVQYDHVALPRDHSADRATERPDICRSWPIERHNHDSCAC